MSESDFKYGKLEDMDRSFDVAYWQKQGKESIFKAAWDLVVQAHLHKGRDIDELRFSRSVSNFGKLPS